MFSFASNSNNVCLEYKYSLTSAMNICSRMATASYTDTTLCDYLKIRFKINKGSSVKWGQSWKVPIIIVL